MIARLMKVAVSKTKRYERHSLEAAAEGKGIDFRILNPGWRRRPHHWPQDMKQS